MRRWTLLFLFLSSQLTQAQSDYETLVEGVVFNSSSRVVIDEKTIKQSKAPDLVSLITTQANVTLFNNNFQPPQIFLRGGESSHILIMIDGVPTYDVSWAQRTINLNSLNINNVRRIEIIKGGQTVLYGGQALAGVIKIETFASQYRDEKKIQATTALTRFEDNRLGVSYEKALSEDSGFKASARGIDRRNQSPILDSNKLYDQFNDNVDLNYEKQGSTLFRARGFYFKDKAWNPTTVNIMGKQSLVDSDVQRLDEQSGLSAYVGMNEIMWKPRLSLFGQQGRRYFYSGPESQNVNARFRSQLQGLIFEATPVETHQFTVVIGLSYQKEDFFFDDSKGTFNQIPKSQRVFQESQGTYLMGRYRPLPEVQIEAGTRREKVSRFNEYQSYQVGVTLYEKTKMEWVTGFRAPGTAQKYGVFENRSLQPETSQTYSLTHDLKIGSQGDISATLFETSFGNYIEARNIGMGILQYQNTAKVKTRGVELASSYLLNSNHHLQLSYAYQEPWDQVRHTLLRRRPRVSGTIRLFHTEEKMTAMIEGTGVGQRNDFFASSQATFPGYFLLNASASYKFSKDFNLSLRVSNILNFRPELSIDFYGESRNAWLTAEYTW
jgi:iron complex outermembrane receptor protein